MPKDNIQRALDKADGADAENYEEAVYEGYGSGGVGFVIEALTDNRNRTAANLRKILNKAGGTLAEGGAVTFMFEQLGTVVFPPGVAKDDVVLEAAIEAGADDVFSDDEEHRIVCARENLGEVAGAMEETLGAAPEQARLIWSAYTPHPVDESGAEKVMNLLETLNDDEDVQAVYTNVEFGDEAFAKLLT